VWEQARAVGFSCYTERAFGSGDMSSPAFPFAMHTLQTADWVASPVPIPTKGAQNMTDSWDAFRRGHA
jgi:hypothetical protein